MFKSQFRSFLFLLLAIVPFFSTAQDGEFGIFAGGSYYIGEFNPSRHVVPSKPAFGIFYDRHINARYTFRTIATYGQLQADDNMHNIGMNNFRDLGFKARVIDLSGQIVFNFHEFGNTLNVKSYTPYIFIGLAVFNVNPEVTALSSDTTAKAFPKGEGSSNVTSIAVPFGAGFKAIFGNITLGIEWNIRKTWNDNIDGLDNQYTEGNTIGDPIQYNQPKGYQKGLFNNNDWYSFIGLTISYRPKVGKNACPGMD